MPVRKERQVFSNMIRWIKCTAALGAAVLLQLYGTAAYYAWQLPDSYYVQTGSRLEVDTALHFLYDIVIIPYFSDSVKIKPHKADA